MPSSSRKGNAAMKSSPPPPRLSSSLLPRSSPSFPRRPHCTTRMIHHLRRRRQCARLASCSGPTPLHEFPPSPTPARPHAPVHQLGLVIYGVVVVFPGQARSEVVEKRGSERERRREDGRIWRKILACDRYVARRGGRLRFHFYCLPSFLPSVRGLRMRERINCLARSA